MGQTPDEMYFGKGDAMVIDLAAARVGARQERMEANRMAACRVCAGDPEFSALQLQQVGVQNALRRNPVSTVGSAASDGCPGP